MDSLPGDWASRAVEAAPDAVVVVDGRGRVVSANGAAAKLFGRARRALIGQPLTDVLAGPGDDVPGWPAGDRPRAARARDGAGGEAAVELTSVVVSEDAGLRVVFARRALAHSAGLERLLAAGEDLVRMGTFELDLGTLDATWSDELYRLHGFAPGEVTPSITLLVSLAHPEDRAVLAALLESVVRHPNGVPRAGTTVEYRVVLPDGSVRDMRAHGRVERAGGRARWLGAVQDITQQRLTDRELQAHYGVSQALREWESFEEGVVDLLRRIGTALEYPMGSLWLWDPQDDALACRAFWHAPAVDPGGFEEAMRRLRFRPGEGKPGQAWATERPVVTDDVERDPVFRPRDAAVALGLRSAVAFPAVGPDAPVAVLSFYSLERRVPSASLVRTLTGIGRDLGRFLHRRRGALEPRRLSRRELEVLQLAAAGNSGPEIAERLTVSLSTIKTHMQHIYEKLGVSDRAAAVAYALRCGLIE